MSADLSEETITILLSAEMRAGLNALARATARAPADLVGDAIDAYLELQRWQAKHIEEGLRQAEAGEFASDEDVAAAYARWR